MAKRPSKPDRGKKDTTLKEVRNKAKPNRSTKDRPPRSPK